MRFFCIFTLLFASACLDEELVVLKDCGASCAITPYGNLVKEQDKLQDYGCNFGTIICKDGVETCEGYIPYSEEKCDRNNIDENCDGVANNINLQYYDYRNDCEGLGVCENSIKSCTPDGDWVCIPPATYGEEICDNLDNDCDGLTDSEDPDLVMAGSAYYYSGPPETINVGECRAGVLRCIDGEAEYFGEVTPRAEICGNGDDDDCDGLIDEPSNVSSMALLLVIDFSGSMDLYISYVIDAVCLIAEDQEFDSFMIGIQAVASNISYFPYLSTVSQFSSPIEACENLSYFYNNLTSTSGSEFIGEAILQTTDESSDIYLEWPDRLEKSVIFFSDEEPQDIMGSLADLNNEISQDCRENNYSLGGFTQTIFLWDDFVNQCDGWLESLSTSSTIMMDALQRRFVGSC